MIRKEDTNFSNGKILICFICHSIGHFAKHCKNSTCRSSQETQKKVWKMKTKEQRNKKPVSRVPLGKIWRIKEDSKDIEEINISNIDEVSKDDDEHNYTIDKKGIHYKEKQDGDVKGYTDKNEGDEEGCSDDCGFLS